MRSEFAGGSILTSRGGSDFASGEALVASFATAGCDQELLTEQEDVAGEVVESLSSATIISIPLYFHFLYDRIDPVTGLPAYPVAGGTRLETILDVDTEIANENSILAASAGADSRRLRFVRVGVTYAAQPAQCPDQVSTVAPKRVFGAINVIMTSVCGGNTSAPYATRAEAGSLLHELGHALGLVHTFSGNADWNTVEFLHRDRNPSSSTSCYRRGDYTCDTPPDYGYVGYNVCNSLIAGHDLCVQDGAYPFGSGAPLAACDPSDSVVDATGVCTNLATGMGRRTYDPALLGLYTDRPANRMSYQIPGPFTQEQFLRMHNYVQWRIRLPDWVPASEKQVRFGYFAAPGGLFDPIWDLVTDRNYALANVQTMRKVQSSTVALPTTITLANTLSPSRRRVMAVRVRGNITGTPSANFRVTVTPPRGATPAVIPATSIRFSNGQFTADEAFAPPSVVSPLVALRGLRSVGNWSVTVEDGAGVYVSNLVLELDNSDRGYFTNDRAGRGVSDVMVYRPSASQVWISSNSLTAPGSFDGGIYNQASAQPGTKVISGDVDGDGAVDILSRNGSSIWVAFNEDAYTVWRPGQIAGTDLPSASDEVMMGDFDGDGFADLMRRRPNYTTDRGEWRYHRGLGNGYFEAALSPSIGGSAIAYVANVRWTVGDLEGDGRSDLILRVNGSGLFWVSTNTTAAPTSDGRTPTFYGGWNPQINGSPYAFADTDRLVSMDVNWDGRDDIVVRRNGTGQWMTSLNQGGGSFGPITSMTIGGSSSAYLDTDTVLGALP